MYYHLLLLVREVTALDAWSQIICPSEPAALTASKQACKINGIRI